MNNIYSIKITSRNVTSRHIANVVCVKLHVRDKQTKKQTSTTDMTVCLFVCLSLTWSLTLRDVHGKADPDLSDEYHFTNVDHINAFPLRVR